MRDSSIIVSINGKLIPSSQATISIFDNGLLNGFGAFETMLAQDKTVFRLAAHLARFENSCVTLGLSLRFNGSQLAEFIGDALARIQTDTVGDTGHHFRIRLMYTGGAGGAGGNGGKAAEGLWGHDAVEASLIIIVQNHELSGAPESPLAELINSATPAHWLTHHKTLSRMMYSHPASDISKGKLQLLYHPLTGVTEFSIASLFVRQGQQILTSLVEYVFPGICRATIIDNWSSIAPEYDLLKRKVEIADLLSADEVIGVNSLRGAFAISELAISDLENSSKSPTKSPTKTIQYLQSSFSRQLRNFLIKR